MLGKSQNGGNFRGKHKAKFRSWEQSRAIMFHRVSGLKLTLTYSVRYNVTLAFRCRILGALNSQMAPKIDSGVVRRFGKIDRYYSYCFTMLTILPQDSVVRDYIANKVRSYKFIICDEIEYNTCSINLPSTSPLQPLPPPPKKKGLLKNHLFSPCISRADQGVKRLRICSTSSD